MKYYTLAFAQVFCIRPGKLKNEVFFMREMFCVPCAWQPFYGRTFRDWSQFFWSNFGNVLYHRSQNTCPWLTFPLCIL